MSDLTAPTAPVTVTDAEAMASAMAFLDAIDEETWEQVCGDQGRNEFARFALDNDEDIDIEAEWSAVLAHSDSLVHSDSENPETA